MASLSSLKLADYPDPELLAIVQDVADDDGWATAKIVANQLGVQGEHEGHGARCVSSRFAYLKRIGLLEVDVASQKSTATDTKWRVTAIGNALMRGRLNKTQEKMLTGMDPAARIRAIRELAKVTTEAGDSVRQVSRREWRRNAEMKAR
jgi:hypothetical protein